MIQFDLIDVYSAVCFLAYFCRGLLSVNLAGIHPLTACACCASVLKFCSFFYAAS